MISRITIGCALLLSFSACSGKSGNGITGWNGLDGGGSGGGTIGHPILGSGGNADGVGDPCENNQDGMTRRCCGTGMQTCGGPVEFKMWGPCLNDQGQQVTCSVPGQPNKCGEGEFAQYCDGGVAKDAGWPGKCGEGEFGPDCDGGKPPEMPKLCTDRAINNEPEILVGYAPASGQSVAANGQIKVWINDECPELIAPGEQLDPNTGAITAPGDRTAKAIDNYLWEPALYIAPNTAESGGTPHFPQFIKGWYNNGQVPPEGFSCRRMGIMNASPGAPMEPAPPGTNMSEMYSTEVIWNVSDLGLSPGSYIGEFVIHDGDHDRAIGCVTITITP
ncbi:MAG TPA: hypothetical protein VHM19_01110 [Polyangiales bacterium]|nr:hypothetical protein [Polyangiales bacterium]